MQQKANYWLEMEEEIARLSGRKKLLLHVCCAPCSTACLEFLSKYFHVSVFFDNPNIDSQEEFSRRLEEEKRFVAGTGYAEEIIVVPYESGRYTDVIQGLEDEKEGGKRCHACFRLRLFASAKYAKEHGFDYFTTSLTISPHKNAAMLNQIGKEAMARYGVAFLPSDFKKKEGYKRSIILSDEFSLYRQDYCGCVYSKNDAEHRRKAKEEADREKNRNGTE